ncbi:MAG: hypothetical protein IJJ71_01260 [Treponema sp.]|uniref:hypothetical protein n=1 Tax=Treponema sp. TaxID=166 RepID=UPI0026013C0C|nr:hypothetical protein [Treponema sp.]MBR0494787.1 hypothetical protein [Treponema sp.]
MKRILKAAAALAVLVMGASSAFADEAQYKKLLAEAKGYEAKKQYASALGAYWDAVAAEPTEKAKEAYDAFVKLEAVIKDGKPGYGEFDEFSLYDDWVILLKDCERYFTENPAHCFLLSAPQKGDIDRATRTATYTVTVTSGFSEKAVRILNDLQVGMKKSRKKDWTEISEDWPFVSVYANSFKEGSYLKNGVALFYQDGDKIKISGTNNVMGGKRIVAAAFANSAWVLSDSDVSVKEVAKDLGRSDRYMTRNERRAENLGLEVFGSMMAGMAQTMSNFSLYDITLAIVDENGKELAKGARMFLDNNKKAYSFSGINQDTMKLIDGGKAKVVPVLLALEYGKPEKNGITRDRTWLKPLPEIKYDVKQAVWSQESNVNVISKFEKDAQQAAEHAKLAGALNDFTNDFVKIEKGTFADTNSFYDSHAWGNRDFKRDVILSSFFISKNPISKEVYESITGIKREHRNSHNDRINIACMSWYEAVQLCNRLSIMSGLPPCYAINGNIDVDTWEKEPERHNVAFWNSITCDFNADGYRLPTFAELKCLAQAKDIFSVNLSNEISGYLCWDRRSNLELEKATETVVDPITNQTDTSEREVWLSLLRNNDGTPANSGTEVDSNCWSVYFVRSVPAERITEEQKAEIFANIAKAKQEAEDKEKAEALAAQKQKAVAYANDLVTYKKTMVAKTVVPQEVFEFIMGYNPSEKKGERYAATNVNFYEIMVFCNKMSELAGLTPVYAIKDTTDTNSWGKIPTSSNADWDKYKFDKKANGFKLSEIAVRSDRSYIDEVDRTELINNVGVRRAPTDEEAIMKKEISYITSQNIPERIGNGTKSGKYSFRIMRNK